MEERIRGLLPRVRDSRVREAVEALLDGRNQMIPVIGPLLEALKDPKSRWPDRMAAVWALGHAKLTPDQKEAAAATIGWYIQNHPLTPVSLLDPPGRAFFHGLSTLVILWLVLFRLNQVVGMVIPMLITTWGLALYVSGAQSREIELASAAVRAVVTTGSPNVLKPILDLHKQAESLRLLRGAREVREGIRMGLAATLEAIGKCEFGGVTSDTIPILASLLRSKDSEVVRHALVALRAVGDGRAIPAVEGLIKSKRHRNLAALAESTLEVLRERQRKAADSANLLRAAAGAADVDEGLLRPVSAGAGNEERLLRAADSVE